MLHYIQELTFTFLLHACAEYDCFMNEDITWQFVLSVCKHGKIFIM